MTFLPLFVNPDELTHRAKSLMTNRINSKAGKIRAVVTSRVVWGNLLFNK